MLFQYLFTYKKYLVQVAMALGVGTLLQLIIPFL